MENAEPGRVGWGPHHPIGHVLPHPAAGPAGAVSRLCLWSPGLIGISSRLLAGLVSGPGRAWACVCQGVSACARGRGGTGGACRCHAGVHPERMSQLPCVSMSTGVSAHFNMHTEEAPPQICPWLDVTPMMSTRADVRFHQCSLEAQKGRKSQSPHGPSSAPPGSAPTPRLRLLSSGTSPSDSTLISPSRYFPQLAPLPSHPGPASSPPISSRPPPVLPGHRGLTHFCASEGRPGHASPAGLGQRRRRKRRPGPQLPEQGPHGPHEPHVASGERAGMGASGGRPPQKPRIW